MRVKDENKEKAIRAEAVKLIVAEGFDGLSMHKLAKAANVSASTLYVYFQNREDLLNKTYIEVQKQQALAILKDFDPFMNFEQGLWLQWKNRYRYVLANPIEHQFIEQFRNSPLIHANAMEENSFIQTMSLFFEHAIAAKELKNLPGEMLWSLAFGSFYALIRFGLSGKGLSTPSFILTEEILKQTFDLTILSLKPLIA